MPTPPTSTYRLQITPSWQLDQAAALADYLTELGAGAVYCSPLLTSAAGSEHGYDVVGHDEIDPARGGRTQWLMLVARVRELGLDLVVDIVPNHVGVADASANAAWWDVLRLGHDSPYAGWFDVEWARGRVLLPVLGDDVDLASELTVVGDELRYYDHRFPIAPGTAAAAGESAADVHDRQHYELVNYRRADTEQNYRRFFAVTTLAGLRVEDPDVFAATHREILRWVDEDGVGGLRIDHPDGLVDPEAYLRRLADAAPGAWITVEKILEPGEILPAQWPVAGTTGYDALTEVAEVLVDPAAQDALDDLYRISTGDTKDFAGHVEAGKRFVVSTILQAEINRLARLVPDVPDAAEALAELVIAFPVYRSYLPYGDEHLAAAVTAARARRPDLGATIDNLLPRLGDPADELCARFQQTTGAVMAKGVEDTAYYRYSRFVAANEVGGDPATVGRPLGEFHSAQKRRQDGAGQSMTTLSTHDTKRGEDVRARMSVIAEFPDEWAAVAGKLLDAAPVPNRSFGYLLWQTLVGTGFIERERMHAYAEKAMREASDGTRWVDPDAEFEASVHAAVDRVYDDAVLHGLVADFVSKIEPYGWANALSQKLIQLTMPGVPDVYQGTEFWDDSLVDPDNRRPVDYAARRRTLGELDSAATAPPVDATGAAKLWLVSRALRLRRDHPDSFASYTPLTAYGQAADHLVAFDRGRVIAVATRLPATLERGGGWGTTTVELPDGEYLDVLTGRRYSQSVPVGELLAGYPVALLTLTS